MAFDPLPLDFGRDKKFCIYVYRDPRPRQKRQAIYVGKGDTTRRPDMHWRYGVRLNPLFSAVLRKIKAAGLEPIIEIIQYFDNEEAALVAERAMIAHIGRRNLNHGTLCNLTDGGEGGKYGFKTDEQTRLAHSKASIALWQKPEFRAKMKESQTGMMAERWSDEEFRETMHKAQQARWAHPEEREKISRAKTGKSSPKSDNRFLTANGETKTLAEWARTLGCTPSAILRRLGLGWSEERAVTIPAAERPNSKLTYEQACEIRRLYPEVKSTRTLGDQFGVSKVTIQNILNGKIFRPP